MYVTRTRRVLRTRCRINITSPMPQPKFPLAQRRNARRTRRRRRRDRPSFLVVRRKTTLARFSRSAFAYALRCYRTVVVHSRVPHVSASLRRTQVRQTCWRERRGGEEDDDGYNEAQRISSLARSRAQIVPVCRKFTVNYCVAISKRGALLLADYLTYFHVFTSRFSERRVATYPCA